MIAPRGPTPLASWVGSSPAANSRRAWATTSATRLPPALGEAAAQESYELRLSVDIELFGGVKGIGKCVLLIHGNLPIGDNSSRLPGT